MSWKIHQFIEIVLQFATFFGIVVFSYSYFGDFHFFRTVIMAFIGVLAVSFLWRLVPVKCPSGNCNGKAYGKGRKPVIYQCSKCGYIHDTGTSIRLGGGPF
jgi:hypothetical protein